LSTKAQTRQTLSLPFAFAGRYKGEGFGSACSQGQAQELAQE